MVVLLPFLAAFGAIAYLWAQNAEIVNPATVVAPTLVVLLSTAIVFGFLTALTRRATRSALTVVVLLVIVLSHGYQVDAMVDIAPAIAEETIVWLVVGVDAVVATAVLVVIWRASSVRRAGEFGTLVGAVFVALSLPPILAAAPSVLAAQDRDPPPVDTEHADLPDIYYIVLDGYARHDVLAEVYGYDNEPFLRALEQRGFFIAGDSYSNYAQTPLSLASTLHMRYLEDGRETTIGESGRGILRDLIHDPLIARELREFGYRYVAFTALWWGTDAAPNADMVFSRANLLESEFSLALLRTTFPGRFFVAQAPVWHETHLYTLSELREVPQIEGPTFTFAHILLPHPPYVFDAQGRVREHEGQLRRGWRRPAEYVAQTKFLNAQLDALVDDLIAASERMPIIILQGDHGPARKLEEGDEDLAAAYWERMAILNAYLVPDSVRARLYPSISPVNTFRAMLNGLFEKDLPLLADRSYFNWYPDALAPALPRRSEEIRDVTDIIRIRVGE